MLVVYIFLLVASLLGVQYLIKLGKSYLNGKLTSLNPGTNKSFADDIEDFKSAVAVEGSGVERVRDAIVVFENLTFVAFTILVLLQNFNFFENIKILGIVASAWITIKVVGNYQQWSSKYIGRAIFYGFLLGTLLNIFGAVMVGYAIFSLFLQ